MKKGLLQLMLVIGVIALTLSACAAPVAAPAVDGDAAATAGEAPAESSATGGTIIWLGHQEVASLSPNDAGPTVHWAMISNIHNALLEVNGDLELEPVLAESYEVSEDGLQYTFHLHQGVKFHDGSDFTAEDVKYTFEFYSNVDNGSTLANNFIGMAAVETPDDYTVVINMESVNAAFLANAVTTWIVPSDYHAEIGEDAYTAAPIGTGAFKVVEWVPAEYTLLEAFDDHFRGRPAVDFLRQETVPEPSVRAIALETGDADSATWPLLVEDSIRLRDEEGFPTYSTPAGSVKHFPLNNKSPVLSDKRVRQAMLMALDRQRIIDDLWNGAAVVATANLSPASPFYTADVKTYDFDIDAANALLEEAGWTMGADGVRVNADGLRLSFTCTTITGDQARRPIAEFAQQAFQEIGVEMLLEEAPVAAILEAMNAGEMDCSLFNWTYGGLIDPDAATTLRSDGANNFSHFENARVDELLDLGLQETNFEARQAIYHEIQAIVAEEVPFLFLQYDEWFNVHSPRMTNIPDPATTKGGSFLYPWANFWGVAEGG